MQRQSGPENLHLKHHYIVATALWVQNLVVEANSWIRFQNDLS